MSALPASPAPTAGPRPIVGLDSRVGVPGDFDIGVEYLIHSLPRPAKEVGQPVHLPHATQGDRQEFNLPANLSFSCDCQHVTIESRPLGIGGAPRWKTVPRSDGTAGTHGFA